MPFIPTIIEKERAMSNPEAGPPPANGVVLILEALAQAERGPTPAELAAAPILRQWQLIISIDDYIVLGGAACGHPILGSDYITTSSLLGLAGDLSWCRTLSRLYRLKDPLEVELDFRESSGSAVSLNIEVVLSRICAAPSARLGRLAFECQGAFPPNAECRRRGL